MQSAAPASPHEARVDLGDWTRSAWTLLEAVPGVRRAGLALPEGGGRRLRFTASDRTEDGAVDWCHIDAYDDVPLNTAVRSGEAVVGSLDELEARYAGFVAKQREAGTRAVAAVPLEAAGQTVGAYVLFFDRIPDLDPGSQGRLARLGAELGSGLRRAQQTLPRPLADDTGAGTDDPDVVVHAVADDPAAVRTARRFLRTTLEGWGVDEDTREVAALCLSELVTNALLHTGGACLVRLAREHGGVLTVSVRDGGASTTATASPTTDPLQVHGRGLHLVDALSARWGSDLDEVGTTVWFVLET